MPSVVVFTYVFTEFELAVVLDESILREFVDDLLLHSWWDA
jgi:hypothetical protein